MATLTATSNGETLEGTNGADSLTAKASDNVLIGLDGDDTLISLGARTEMLGGAGADTMIGGSGDVFNGGGGADTAFLDFTGEGQLVQNLARVGTKKAVVFDDGTKLVGVESLFLALGKGADRITLGGAADFAVFGGRGGDSVIGGNAGDTLAGGMGQDTLSGGRGDDLLFAFTPDTLLGFDVPAQGKDDAASDALKGGEGADTLVSGKGDDILDGGEGDDTVSYVQANAGGKIALVGRVQSGGPAGADYLLSVENIIGSNFSDDIIGNDAANRLDGGGENDTIFGGLGSDIFTGGAGRDTFVFRSLADSPLASPDLITDLSGVDKIELFYIDANSTIEDNQAFKLVGALSGKAGEIALRYDAGADVTYVEMEVNGDGVVDGVIALAGDQTDFTRFTL